MPACAPSCAAQQLSTASAAAIRDRLFAAFDPFHHDAVRARAHRQAQAARPVRRRRSSRSGRSAKPSPRAASISPRSATWTPTQRTRRSPRCTASGRGPPTSICCSASATPTRFRPAISRCRNPRASPSSLRKRPDAKALTKIAEAWRPWRGVAAHLLWAYYHAVKKRDVVPVQPTWHDRKRRPKAKDETKRKKQEWLNSTARGLSRARARRASWSCSCTATAPTATT